MIEGGYYIKARCIQESEVAEFPPHTREIWDWLLKEANHKDVKHGNVVIKRGQCVKTYKDIIDGLKWRVGYRWQRYTKWQCEKAMKLLTKHQMVTTTKTTRGLFITICNYDTYQDQKNYESHNEGHKKATRKPQCADTINKNDKNGNNISYKNKKYNGALDEVIKDFCTVTGRRFKLNEDREDLIIKRLDKGYTVADFQHVHRRFVEDDWPDRHKHMDPVYAWGCIKGRDNFEKWLNKRAKIKPLHERVIK